MGSCCYGHHGTRFQKTRFHHLLVCIRLSFCLHNRCYFQVSLSIFKLPFYKNTCQFYVTRQYTEIRSNVKALLFLKTSHSAFSLRNSGTKQPIASIFLPLRNYILIYRFPVLSQFSQNVGCAGFSLSGSQLCNDSVIPCDRSKGLSNYSAVKIWHAVWHVICHVVSWCSILQSCSQSLSDARSSSIRQCSDARSSSSRCPTHKCPLFFTDNMLVGIGTLFCANRMLLT